jgi:hypothetical protein
VLDYNYITETGARVPVSRMAMGDILSILRDGMEISDLDGVVVVTEKDVLERLRIEVLIRELGL